MPAEALFDISEPGESRAKEACEPRASRAIGIDLGTTNSLVATVVDRQPRCLSDADAGGEAAGASESIIVPSVVHYAPEGGVVVGAAARDQLAPRFPQDTIASAKRFMGRGPRDAEATIRLTPYRFAPERASDNVVRFAVAGGTRAVTPIEVSAEILRVLKVRAEAALGGPLDGAVITVPAYFDDAQRQATRDAGRLAGLEVLRLVNEPTAAALAYGLDKQAEGLFAVFDLGGGTFDVSVLKLEGGVFEVKSTGGDSALGGDDFDRAIAAHLLRAAGMEDHGGGDPKVARRVLDAARAAKEALTTQAVATVSIQRPDGTQWRGQLAKAEMEALVAPILERTAPAVRQALADAGVSAAQLSGVILVGGATRMPLVRQFVQALFGREPLGDIDPDQVVALGAAVQADLLAGAGRDDVVLLDVVPLSLGLEMMGGVVEKLIHRNTTVPCGATQTFTTYAENQTGFALHVLQGERELAGDCRSLARFALGGIPPMPAGMARLEVTFVVDADGILNVSAKELTTGKEASIQVKPSYGLSDEEVEQMLLESYANAETDVNRRLLAEQRVEADRILMATRTAMETTPELLTPGDRTAIAAALQALELAKAGEVSVNIKAAIEALDLASKDFAQRRMNRALERGFSGRPLDEVEAEIGGGGSPGHHVHQDKQREEI
jgi:molecular chaperone HscA